MGYAQRFENWPGSAHGASRPDARWWPDVTPPSDAGMQPIMIVSDIVTLSRRDADMVLLVVSIGGDAEVAVGAWGATIAPGAVAVLAAGSSVSVKPLNGADVVVLAVSRAYVQMLRSAAGGRPRLLRHISLLLDDPDHCLLGIARDATARIAGAAGDAAVIIDRASRCTVQLLRGPATETAWRTSRPLERAIDLLLATAVDGLEPATVASRAGITEKSLQRGLQACTGMTISHFVTEARLARARAALSNMRETRSIGALAHRSGFHDSSSFARAYRRRFGESPSVTRARCILSFSYSSLE